MSSSGRPSSGRPSSGARKKKGGTNNTAKNKAAGRAARAKEDEEEEDEEGRNEAIDKNKHNKSKNCHDPVQGSWVAELEEAVASLMEWFEQDNQDESDIDVDHLIEALRRHVRVCRAYDRLRRWDDLSEHAQGLVAQFSDVPAEVMAMVPAWKRYLAELQAYQKRAHAELAVESLLKYSGAGLKITAEDGNLDRDRFLHQAERRADGSLKNEQSFKSGFYERAVVEGCVPDMFERNDTPFGNANMMQEAVLNGDVRLMEEMVALGCSVDRPFREVKDRRLLTTTIIVPSTSALVAACVVLAIIDSSNPRCAVLKMGLPKRPEVVAGIVNCAIQLVHLGADVHRKYVLRGTFNMQYYVTELDGKTAFQIASMTKRRDLVAAMAEHRKVTPKERAETLVHCRCGSRLPWKQCHSTGIGQPPHYITKEDGRIHYRVSPSARCPCGIVPKTYYRCCWRDNGKPTYMDDKTGFHFGTYINAAPAARERLKSCVDEKDPAHAEFLKAYYQGKEDMKESVRQIRESDEHFQELCKQWGPKSKISTWDRAVYAGCLERLNEGFYWTDVHWDLDQPELLRRAMEWNRALQAYCNDAKLSGDERARVVERHTARLCAPCGYAGCSAVENEVRDFQRCSRCKKIAYCGRECQKKDWGAGHKKACKEASVFEDGPASRK